MTEQQIIAAVEQFAADAGVRPEDVIVEALCPEADHHGVTLD